MSQDIVTIGNPNIADTCFCPSCGLQIDYYGHPPNYCPRCGTEIYLTFETVEEVQNAEE